MKCATRPERGSRLPRSSRGAGHSLLAKSQMLLCGDQPVLGRRPMRTLITLPFIAGFCLFGVLACSSSDSSTSSTSSSGSSGAGGSTSSTSCADVCAAIATTCGATPPSCDGACASFSDAAKKCIVNASSCAAIDACGDVDPSSTSSSSTSSSTTSSTSSGPSGPCASCTSTQYCVDQSSVASELGCFDPPEFCNGTTNVCLCFYEPGTPCSKGAKGCTSGAAGNTVSCK